MEMAESGPLRRPAAFNSSIWKEAPALFFQVGQDCDTIDQFLALFLNKAPSLVYEIPMLRYSVCGCDSEGAKRLGQLLISGWTYR